MRPGGIGKMTEEQEERGLSSGKRVWKTSKVTKIITLGRAFDADGAKCRRNVKKAKERPHFPENA